MNVCGFGDWTNQYPYILRRCLNIIIMILFVKYETNMIMDYFGLKLVNLHLGDNGTKTLRQLQAEEDDEERFQADLKQAVRQSLGKSLLLLLYS